MKKKVYVAGPYTKGDVVLNVRVVISAADALAERGFVPFVPHLTHLWHLVSPHDIRFWYDYDNEWLAACDVLLRLPGDSAGADAEVALAKKLGKPVFPSVDALVSDETWRT